MDRANKHRLLRGRPFESYADYLAETGENAVARGAKLPTEELVLELVRSGLRGRGGGGFPTGVKWRTLRDHPSPTKFVVCNAAEGEPGTFKDRYLLRNNPYSTLEGMLIAMRAIGA